MIHVHQLEGAYVASIHKQDKLAAGYRKEEPWLLLYRTGRTDRFDSLQAARAEAKKTWPRCTFHRS